MKIELEKIIDSTETYYKLIFETSMGHATQKINCEANIDQIVSDLMRLTLQIKNLSHYTLNSKKYEGENYTKSFEGCGQEC